MILFVVQIQSHLWYEYHLKISSLNRCICRLKLSYPLFVVCHPLIKWRNICTPDKLLLLLSPFCHTMKYIFYIFFLSWTCTSSESTLFRPTFYCFSLLLLANITQAACNSKSFSETPLPFAICTKDAKSILKKKWNSPSPPPSFPCLISLSNSISPETLCSLEDFSAGEAQSIPRRWQKGAAGLFCTLSS